MASYNHREYLVLAYRAKTMEIPARPRRAYRPQDALVNERNDRDFANAGARWNDAKVHSALPAAPAERPATIESKCCSAPRRASPPSSAPAPPALFPGRA